MATSAVTHGQLFQPPKRPRAVIFTSTTPFACDHVTSTTLPHTPGMLARATTQRSDHKHNTARDYNRAHKQDTYRITTESESNHITSITLPTCSRILQAQCLQAMLFTGITISACNYVCLHSIVQKRSYGLRPGSNANQSEPW